MPQPIAEYPELMGEDRVIRNISNLLLDVCLDIYLVFCSLRNAPRYRPLLQEVFAMASLVEHWLEDLGDIVDKSSFLYIIFDQLVESSYLNNSSGTNKYVHACLMRTRSQRSLHEAVRENIWDFRAVMEQFNVRMESLTRLVKSSPEGAKIASRISSLNLNVYRLLSITNHLLRRLSHNNRSFETHVQKFFNDPSIKPSESEVRLVKSRCYNSTLDLVALREELKEQQLAVKWNLNRLSSPFEPMEVRASNFRSILAGTQFLDDSKKDGDSDSRSGRVVMLKHWFARVVRSRKTTSINV